jgi:NodT family efflux transporter outer membrane factor (OMF) lipoprotein
VLLNGSWELDLFDRQRHTLDSALGELRASQADAQAAQVLLATQVAAGYISLARLIEMRALADQSVSQFDQALALVSQRVAAGLDTRVEQRQAETVSAQARAERLALDELIIRQRHALAELTGQRPDALDSLTPALFSVPGLGLPDELPADLVGRRADLVAQRWRVEAALSGIEVTRSGFYPSINLIGFVGLSSLGLDRLIDLGSRTHAVGPAFRLPIFDGGALRARLRSGEAAANAAIEAYNATLLKALREVRDEVVSIQSIQDQARAQSDALRAAQAAHALAIERYRAGLGNYLTVLTVQNTLIAQQRAMTDLRARALSSELMLVRALGGGVQEDPETRLRGAVIEPTLLAVPASKAVGLIR